MTASQQGQVIIEVQSGSVLEKMGIKPNDKVISFDGKSINSVDKSFEAETITGRDAEPWPIAKITPRTTFFNVDLIFHEEFIAKISN